MRTLAGPNRRCPGGDLCAARLRTFGEKAPGLLFNRYAAEAGLKPQTLGHFVVKVADDDRRHRDAIVA